MYKRSLCIVLVIGFSATINMSNAQNRWINVDSAFQPLPPNFHVFKTIDSIDGKPFIAFSVKAKLKEKAISFTADTTSGRRLSPLKFYEKNDRPLLVVNCTFFNFDRHQNLNTVIKNNRLVGYYIPSIPMRGKDTFQYSHPLASAIGITKNREADIAWLFTDSSKRFAYASQLPMEKPFKDSVLNPSFSYLKNKTPYLSFRKWKMQTAVGGGPVLVQNGQVKITNNEELRFTGKAINDKHPRTCMGYTNDGYLIIMVIQGRFPVIAEGATLTLEAQLMIELGCIEAINLDGGGSSCMLINGKETIKPSDKEGQRPVPAVFMILKK